jgi:hypothetical protein
VARAGSVRRFGVIGVLSAGKVARRGDYRAVAGREISIRELAG